MLLVVVLLVEDRLVLTSLVLWLRGLILSFLPTVSVDNHNLATLASTCRWVRSASPFVMQFSRPVLRESHEL